MKFKNIVSFKTIPSTNTYLKDNYLKLDNYTVVTTLDQTNGRGRMDRSWISGDDLLISILLKSEFKVEDLPKINMLVVSTLYTTLKEYLNISIKWPNDIIVNSKKLAGILIESSINNGKLECIIIGIGVNVNTNSYNNELLSKATSLKLETNQYYNINVLRDKFLASFNKTLDYYLSGNLGYLNIYKENLLMLGEVIEFTDFSNFLKGRFIEVLDNGNIIVEVDGKLIEYSSGEISLTKTYK